MRIAVVGRGNVGSTVGAAFSRSGHTVVYGSRGGNGGAPDVTDIATAIRGSDVVLLAIPATAVTHVLAGHGAALNGKLVIDATNMIGAPIANAASAIAEAAPQARYARAFNTLGWENFADPDFDGVRADLLFSCADTDRAQMSELIDAVGLRPIYLGPGAHDAVDAALPLWFALTQAHGGNRHLALRVLTD